MGPALLQVPMASPIRGTITKKGTTVTDANPEPRKLCLDQFLKLSSIAGTGGHAKFMIQNGEVKVNGLLETRRRRQLFADDIVEVGGQRFPVKSALFVE